jgi:hypothetical protein
LKQALGRPKNTWKYNIKIDLRETLKHALGRSKNTWKDNIKIDLREIVPDGLHLLPVSQDVTHWRALVTTGNRSFSSIKGGKILHQLNDYKLSRTLS